jgi:hypothetical protein
MPTWFDRQSINLLVSHAGIASTQPRAKTGSGCMLYVYSILLHTISERCEPYLVKNLIVIHGLFVFVIKVLLIVRVHQNRLLVPEVRSARMCKV